MPVSVLVTTAGSATANAYVSRLVADQFHLDRPIVGTTVETGLWEDADSNQKDAAILWATKLLDKFFLWNGWVTDPLQRLLWPRYGLYSVNRRARLDPNTIPDEIQWATAELARQLLVKDRTGDSDIETFGLKLIKAGPIRLDFKDSVHAKPIPDIVKNMIPLEWGYLQIFSGMRTMDLLRS